MFFPIFYFLFPVSNGLTYFFRTQEESRLYRHFHLFIYISIPIRIRIINTNSPVVTVNCQLSINQLSFLKKKIVNFEGYV